MTVVATGFSPAGYQDYGQRFLETFDTFWPAEIRLLAFVEEPTIVPRAGERSLWSCPGVREFIDRHSTDKRYRGLEPVPGWTPKDHRKGYSYRYDAVKFCRQCFIPETAAAELPNDDVLVWLDADVVTHQTIPDGFIEKLIGDSELCYLGRKDFHTELGFWAIRLNDSTRSFLNYLAGVWRNDCVFRLNEWHSAFVFDYTRNLFQVGDIRITTKNLTPDGKGHVWFQSPLARYTDHLKGERRKRQGFSTERLNT